MRNFTQKNIPTYFKRTLHILALLIGVFTFQNTQVQVEVVEIARQDFNNANSAEDIISASETLNERIVKSNVGEPDSWLFEANANVGEFAFIDSKYATPILSLAIRNYGTNKQNIRLNEVDISGYKDVGFSINYSSDENVNPDIDVLDLRFQYSMDGTDYTTVETELMKAKVDPADDGKSLPILFGDPTNNATGEANPYFSTTCKANTIMSIPDEAIAKGYNSF